MNFVMRFGAPFKGWIRRLAVLTASLFVISLSAQPAATLSSATPSAITMKTFVIIFRQGPRQLTDADKQHRAEETVAWAKAQNAAGHKLDPRILAPENERRRAENSIDGWPVTALLFLEAHDLAEATQVAEAHPALHYGSEVEVRPWAPPAPVHAPAATR